MLLPASAALPLFISLDDYIPRIDQEISAKLSEPVSIKSTKFAALPLPHVTVDGIMAGAAVGTVILGPGLGTSVGAKVGGWAEGLFGKQDEKKPSK